MNNVDLIKAFKKFYEDLNAIKSHVDKMIDKQEDPDKIDATIKYMSKNSPNDEKQAQDYALEKMAKS